MDDMTIFDPSTGRRRYRVGDDLEVEDLNDPPVCKHRADLSGIKCSKCGKSLEINNQ